MITKEIDQIFLKSGLLITNTNYEAHNYLIFA